MDEKDRKITVSKLANVARKRMNTVSTPKDFDANLTQPMLFHSQTPLRIRCDKRAEQAPCSRSLSFYPSMRSRIGPKRYATKNPQVHTNADPKNDAAQFADLAAPRWVMGCADFTLLQSWSDEIRRQGLSCEDAHSCG